jgi:hypothetical protein
MRTLIAIWLPATFTSICIALALSLSIYFLIPAIFGAGDVRERYKEFRKMIKRGSTVRTLNLMRGSACQRYAAVAAYKRPEEARRYYIYLGYRWYHVLPDGSLGIKNNRLLTARFYLELLGIK